jgi:hypothetical protein
MALVIVKIDGDTVARLENEFSRNIDRAEELLDIVDRKFLAVQGAATFPDHIDVQALAASIVSTQEAIKNLSDSLFRMNDTMHSYVRTLVDAEIERVNGGV